MSERLSPSQQLLQYFAYSHLPEPLKEISGMCAQLALHMERVLPDGPEKTMGLRKLLEAKDCFVRARLEPKDKPWWQTSDLQEVPAKVRVLPALTGLMHAVGVEGTAVIDEPDSTVDQLNTNPEREVARAKGVVGGQCYAPVAVTRDPEDDDSGLVTCFWGFCDWQYAGILDKSVAQYQIDHDMSTKPPVH